ncbi:hypothetical protein ART_3039 [Arthrobacter sp. PAMC 25486]|uniref:DUF6541 family protein n=1 Tax=Arthrobacter sp. PAMC 25486 TaxID=1494608 RepID=UPI0005363469|nr:DUF6541 family protein [Arthrobacter sp. PAMC 25486]AIY02638.1 hypothetical protein ART_3039 [Arthrobacter sp. PAMC 25486]
MSSWFEALPAFAAALLILALPGAAVLTALRVRGLMVVFLAPAVSVSVVAASAIVAPLIGLPWHLPVLLLGTAIAAAGAWLAQRFIPALRTVPENPGWSGIGPVAVGALVSLAITTALLTLVAATPEQFTQGYDSVFHLNATEYAVETSNGSSFAISGFILPSGKAAFYPGAWHGLASLLAIVTGVSIPAATNIMWLAVAGIVWPLSIMFLTRVLFGGRRLLLVCAGILSAAFPAFPWLLLQYGSAYPNSLSNALVPVGIGLVLLILRPAVHTGLEPAQALAVVALFLPGAITAQPNGVFSILLVLTPLLAYLLFAWLRTGFFRSRRHGWSRLALLALVLAATAGALLSLPQIRSLFNYASLAFMPFPLALLRNFTHAPAPIWFPAVALTLLGVAGALAGRRLAGLRWLPAALLLLAFTYPMTAGTDFGPANILMAPWWDNPERIAALMPLLAVPLAALGMVGFVDWLSHRLPTLAQRQGRPAAAVGLVVVLVLSNPGLWQMKGQVGIMYNVPAKPDGLAQVDAQELALIHRLGDYTTEHDVIANNPYNGSALAMALAGRTMLFPYSSQGDLSPDLYTLRFWLNRVGSDADVCAAAKRQGVTFLLDFGTNYIPAFDNPRSLYPGVTLAPDSDAFTLVASEGHARLFKLTTCDGSALTS